MVSNDEALELPTTTLPATTAEVSPQDIIVSTETTTLWGTNDPAQIIERASNIATALAKVIRAKKLMVKIKGREYVRIEGWTLLGSILGVYPVCIFSQPIGPPGAPNGYEARVEARTRDGRIVGAAEAQCSREEKSWSDRDDFALRSMAQTRASGKVLRIVLGFVMVLAGYEATPEEEMPSDLPREVQERAAERSVTRQSITIELLAKLVRICGKDDPWLEPATINSMAKLEVLRKTFGSSDKTVIRAIPDEQFIKAYRENFDDILESMFTPSTPPAVTDAEVF